MKKIYNRILFYFLLILFINFLASSIIVVTHTKRDFDANLKEQLYNYAGIASELVKATGLEKENQKELDSILKELGDRLNIRVSVILPDGSVFADSSFDPESMKNHLFRIEVQNALQGNVGMDARLSPTLGIRMTYLALPLHQNDEIRAVVRVSLFQEKIRRKINQTIFKGAMMGALTGVVIALIISSLLAQSFSRPIRLIRDAARNISGGDFHYHLQLDRNDELREVSESLNEMSRKLGNYFISIKEEKEKISAILSSMIEPLILVSEEQNIVLVNNAFCELFHRDENKLKGKLYWECLLEREIHELIQKALQSRSSHDGDMILRKQDDKTAFLYMIASPVLSDSSVFKGVVIVFHDITPMKEAEKMRREFVDNASHELKTPISSIMAVSETLLEREPPGKDTRAQFYQKLLDNAQRLNHLISDLLSLSEIEQNRNSLELIPSDISGILKELEEDFQPAIKAKRHSFKARCQQDLPLVSLDKKTFKKALGNILDNAIRYTSDNGDISISAYRLEKELIIEIRDSGIGVSPEDLPRIFERFYRVDKARSIKSGGTGLGLSIARRTVEAHGGTISVTSTPGEGSVFTVHLPL